MSPYMEYRMEYRRGGFLCPSPLSTSRNSDRGRGDTRSVDSSASSRSLDRDKGVNVQVLLRCRPLIEAEFKANALQVISCNDPKRQVTVFQSIACKQVDRTFTFDKVFGPSSEQSELYEQAIAPIVDEVLEGFNCTVFAYGQTGTGKTYTMEGGGCKTKDGELPVDAGVIPRAVRQIFQKLESQNAEYSVKVTFLELYNEEITDLLASDCSKSTDDKPRKPIALMEDGKGGVIVRGLEEEVVYSANALYDLLERGSAKRRSTETLLNKQSSRSHSIFSITIHIKEETPEGEELIKCGKLNLVDLAGSENIYRSGAKEGRAREAGEINKSLLTLGRVITSLVERLSHVPYRDSKLTRLLRDSLGGKTKTCIIATVSPSVHCLEETLSTLDYAHRAKNIKNKPEINQKMMKSALIKDLYTEIERLKQEVNVVREKNGIHVPCDRSVLGEVEKKAVTEKKGHMESEMEAKDKQLDELHELYNSQKLLSADLTAKLEMTQKKLEDTEEAANDLKEKYRQANCTIKEKEIIISNLLQSEKALVKRASELRAELESAKYDVAGLFASIGRKDKIETGNQGLVRTFQSQLAQQLKMLHNTVAISVSQQQQQLKQMEEQMQSVVATKNKATEALRNRVESLKTIYGTGIKGLQDHTVALNENSLSTFGRLHSTVSMHAASLQNLLIKSVSEADVVLRDLQSALSEKESKMAANAQQQREGIQRTVESTRVISKIIVDFFYTLESHASKLGDFVEESQTIHDKNLADLEKSYEECAGNEEKRNLEEIAELLANSTARKTKLVRSAVSSLRESTVDKARELQQEMLNMQCVASDFQNQWKLYMKQAEEFYVENTESVAAGHLQMEEILQQCMGKTDGVKEQWKNIKDSLQQLERSNVESVDTTVKTGIHSNQLLLSEFTQAASSADAEVEIGNGRVLSSIDNSLKLDREACENMKFTVAHWANDSEKLRSSHQGKLEQITKLAEKLRQEYMEDQPTCTTPTRRPIPSTASSDEDSRTPCSDEEVNPFLDTSSENISKQENIEVSGEVKQVPPTWDARIPLTAINCQPLPGRGMTISLLYQPT